MILRLYRKILAYVLVRKDPVSYARSLGVKIGQRVKLISIRPGSGTFGSEPYLVELGDDVTVTGDVQFVTHDGGVWVFNSKENEMGDPKNIDVFGRIRVGNNVFIGYGSIILPNVDIGDNCIIAAGSVVTGNVSSDSVVGGVPAKFIKSIDDYAKSIEHRRVMVRTLSPEMKRAKLEEMFQNDS